MAYLVVCCGWLVPRMREIASIQRRSADQSEADNLLFTRSLVPTALRRSNQRALRGPSSCLNPNRRSLMKAKANPKAHAKPDEEQPLVLKPALVVFGRDRSGKPHAAWFTAEEAEAARTAAGLIGYRVLALTTEAQQHLPAQLSRGRLFENGRAFVPFVKAALYETLSKLADAAPESTEAAAPADTAAQQAAPA